MAKYGMWTRLVGWLEQQKPKAKYVPGDTVESNGITSDILDREFMKRSKGAARCGACERYGWLYLIKGHHSKIAWWIPEENIDSEPNIIQN